MELNEFKTSLIDMSDEELQALLSEVRRERLQSTTTFKRQSTTPKIISSVESMSLEDAENLLKLLEERRKKNELHISHNTNCCNRCPR